MKPVLCRDFYIWSLIYHFVRAQSVLQIGENQKSVLFFYPKLWNFEYSKNIKSIIIRKWPLKKKSIFLTSFERTFKKPQILDKSSRIM